MSDNSKWMSYKDWLYHSAYMEIMEEAAIFRITGWLGKHHSLPLTEEVIQERIKLKQDVRNKDN